MASRKGLPKDRSQLFGQAAKAVESPRSGPSSRSRRPRASPPEGCSFPKWVAFGTGIDIEDPDSFREDDPETPSARSVAATVLVSLRLVAPPGASRLRLHYSREAEAKMLNGTALVAAHLDSVLFRVVPPSCPTNPFSSWCCHTDYFVCKAGPSGMSIHGPLPPCYKDVRRMAVQGHAESSHMLNFRDIGLLRRGDEDFAVADLLVLLPSGDSYSVPKEAELFRYRSNALTPPQWEVKRMLICQDDDKDHGLYWWTTDKVVSFEGNLCWIDYHRGVLFCDIFDDDPQLWFAELPVVPPKGNPDHPEYGRAHPFVTRSLSVTEGGAMVFVNVTRADGEIASRRKLGSGFTITSWSLGTPLSSKSIFWVKEGAMEAGEIWSQYPISGPHIPCLSPEFPFVSLNEYNIIYAILCERPQHAAGRPWVLVIDIKRKKLKSVLSYNDVNYSSCGDTLVLENILSNGPLLPSMFSKYLNSHAS